MNELDGGGRHRAARRRVRREGRALHQRPGPRAGRRRARSRLPVRRARTGRSSPTWRRVAGPDARLPVVGRRPRARSPPPCRAGPTRRPRRIAVRPSGRGQALAAGVEPVGAVEVGLHVSGPAAREGPQRPDGRPAEPDPAQARRLIMRTVARLRLGPANMPGSASLRQRLLARPTGGRGTRAAAAVGEPGRRAAARREGRARDRRRGRGQGRRPGARRCSG